MFRPGAHNDHVTRLGRQLVKKGFGRHYTTGPGPRWGEADRRNVEDFQRAQGWRGGAADGYPGRRPGDASSPDAPPPPLAAPPSPLAVPLAAPDPSRGTPSLSPTLGLADPLSRRPSPVPPYPHPVPPTPFISPHPCS